MFKFFWITSPHLEYLYNHVHTWANGIVTLVFMNIKSLPNMLRIFSKCFMCMVKPKGEWINKIRSLGQNDSSIKLHILGMFPHTWASPTLRHKVILIMGLDICKSWRGRSRKVFTTASGRDLTPKVGVRFAPF